MSKYDFENSLSEDTSTGLILKRVKPNSKVLEFGCATGRMTRYMAESLSCDVSIVEIDREAYTEALKYAVDGVCGDIQNYEWREKFNELRFDAIIFADVLEHLSRPEEVLSKAAGLLKEDGRILISIPNVTHNDVIIKALEGNIDYTDVGLLDNTHIHFWGYNNLHNMADASSLSILDIDATLCETGKTEQHITTSFDTNPFVWNYLNEREKGIVYQYIIELGNGEKKIPFSIEERNMTPYIESHIYFDYGNGFSEDTILEKKAFKISEGHYLFEHTIDETGNLKAIRFDPVENQRCILNKLTVTQDGRALHVNPLNGVELDKERIIIVSRDPRILVDTESLGGSISISVEITLENSEYNLAMSELTSTLISDKIIPLEKKKFELEGDIAKLEYLKAELESQKAELIRRNQLIDERLYSYIDLANKKDMVIMERDNLINKLMRIPSVRVITNMEKLISKISGGNK